MTHLLENQQIWQRPEWPYFQWDSSALLDSLVKVKHQQGRLLATAGLVAGRTPPLSDIRDDIVKHFTSPLTKERIFGWHASIFPVGYSGVNKIAVAEYRRKDYVLNSKQRVPPAKNVPEGMKKFLAWWNDSPVGLDGVIRAGLAHFWFATIQPFEDGNGRLSRALTELALAQDEDLGLRPYDLESTFQQNAPSYSEVLRQCQHSASDITPWLNWFFEQLLSSMKTAELLISKSNSLGRFQNFDLNSRQKKILQYLLEQNSEPQAITNRDCVRLCQTSRESAKRDLAQLHKWGILTLGPSRGRSINYSLNVSFRSG